MPDPPPEGLVRMPAARALAARPSEENIATTSLRSPGRDTLLARPSHLSGRSTREDIEAYHASMVDDTEAEAAEEAAAVIFSGRLSKRGHVRATWKTRWFELREGAMVYFDMEGGRPLGAVLLGPETSVVPSGHKPNCVFISTPAAAKAARGAEVEALGCRVHKSLFVECGTSKEKERWMSAVFAVINLQRGPSLDVRGLRDRHCASSSAGTSSTRPASSSAWASPTAPGASRRRTRTTRSARPTRACSPCRGPSTTRASAQGESDSSSLQRACSARARSGKSIYASRPFQEMIARPKISRNEWKTAEIGAFEVGNFAPFPCPGEPPRGRGLPVQGPHPHPLLARPRDPRDDLALQPAPRGGKEPASTGRRSAAAETVLRAGAPQAVRRGQRDAPRRRVRVRLALPRGRRRAGRGGRDAPGRAVDGLGRSDAAGAVSARRCFFEPPDARRESARDPLPPRTAPLQALAKETSLGKAVRRASGRLAGDAATGDAAAERAREGPREALCDDDERAAACESHVNFGDLPKLGDRRVSLTPRSSEAPADDAAPPPGGDATPQLRRYAAWRSRALRRARRHSLRESLPAGANYAAARRRAGVPRKNVSTLRVSSTRFRDRSRRAFATLRHFHVGPRAPRAPSRTATPTRSRPCCSSSTRGARWPSRGTRSRAARARRRWSTTRACACASSSWASRTSTRCARPTTAWWTRSAAAATSRRRARRARAGSRCCSGCSRPWSTSSTPSRATACPCSCTAATAGTARRS